MQFPNQYITDVTCSARYEDHSASPPTHRPDLWNMNDV